MKRHIKGTNSRTLCGNRVTDRTIIVDDCVPEFMSDCTNCLNRLTHDYKKMVQYMNLLHVVCKDTTVLHHVTRLHKQQIKEQVKEDNRNKQKYKGLQ